MLDRISGLAGVLAAASMFLLAPIDPSVSQEVTSASGLLCAMCKLMGDSRKRIADDPPRGDYRRSTYLIPRPVDFTVFGEGRIATPAVRFCSTGNTVNATIDALVRAVERAEGAQLEGESDWVAARTEEANRYAHRAAQELSLLTTEALVLADAFEAATQGDTTRGASDVVASDTRIDELLPPDSLAQLYRSGVRIEEIRRPLFTSDTFYEPGYELPELINALRFSQESTGRLARTLGSGLVDWSDA